MTKLLPSPVLLALPLFALSACDVEIEADDASPDAYDLDDLEDLDAVDLEALDQSEALESLDADEDALESDKVPPPPCDGTNVALGAPVTIYGNHNGDAEVIVDGVFAPEGTGWNNLLYAVTFSNSSTLEIDLEQPFPIHKLILQADNNDVYRVSGSLDQVDWTTLQDFGSVFSPGLRTRPPVDLPGESFRYVRISRVAGDGSNSVSELQVLTKECPY